MIVYAAQPAIPAPPAHFTSISISAAVVCLVLAQLLRWKKLRRIEGLTPWLYLLAGIGLAGPFLRGWVHAAADMGRTIPVLGVSLTVSLAIAAAFVVVYDLWPKHRTNGLTGAAALVLPALAPEIGGAVGVGLGHVLTALGVLGATALGTLFGV